MSRFYFVFVIAATYYLSVSGQIGDECAQKEREACNGAQIPDEFPLTVDELKEACRVIKELADCILPVRENCSNNTDSINDLRERMGYIHEACREDSEIFQAISSNLECLAPIANLRKNCGRSGLTEKTLELILTTFRQYIERQQKEIDDEINCLDKMWLVSCGSVKATARCGSEAGMAVGNIITNMARRAECSEEFIANVAPMLEIVEAALMEDELLKKFEKEKEEKKSDLLEELTTGMEADEEEALEGVRRKRRFASPFQLFRDKILM